MSGEDASVRAELARLPRPVMPADVEAAIRARLADEHKVVPLTRQHRRRLDWLLAAVAAVAFVGLVAVSTTPSAAPVAQSPVVRAGAVFEPARFGEQLRARMQGDPADTPTATFADSPEGIAACARAVQAYGQVMAADSGTYAGAQAVVLVTRYVANTDYAEVWVVEPDCGDGKSGVIRHMIVDVDG